MSRNCDRDRSVQIGLKCTYRLSDKTLLNRGISFFVSVCFAITVYETAHTAPKHGQLNYTGKVNR